jgi:hypothetical protein
MARLGEAAETVLGILWALLIYAWGAVLTGIVLLFPLAAAYAISLVVDGVPTAAALGAGVAVAYVMEMPPWNAEERWSLPVALGAAAASWAGWLLRVGPADGIALVTPLAIAVIGWAVRRGVNRWLGTRSRSEPANA